MKYRKIENLSVSAVGLGIMGMSHGYGAAPERLEAIKLIRQANELGCTFFDTAEGYGNGDNERILGEALKPVRDKVVIATKFGGPKVEGDKLGVQEYTPAQIREHLEASLKRLGTVYGNTRTNQTCPCGNTSQCSSERILYHGTFGGERGTSCMRGIRHQLCAIFSSCQWIFIWKNQQRDAI